MPDAVFERLNTVAEVSRETFERLKLYQQLLLKWQPKINLVGPDTINDCWSRHFIDSLQILPLLADFSLPMIDFGSGAGFPGMVLAVAGATDMHVVESDTKKILFLREVARITATRISIHHCRIEDRPIEEPSVIMSRACASLSQLFVFSLPYVSRGTVCIFPKGKNYFQELLDAKEHWLFDYDIVPSATDSNGAILKITNLRDKKDGGKYEKGNRKSE